MDDRELIGRVLAGDPSAERELYDAHVDRVFRLAYRMAGDLDRAQDYVQETFIRAFQRLADFRGESAPLDLALLDRDLDHAERAPQDASGPRSGRWRLDDAPPMGDARREADPDLKERLTRAIDELPEGYRTVFVMHEVEGYTHEEIAETSRRAARAPRRPSSSAPGPGCARPWPTSRGSESDDEQDDDQLDELLRAAAQDYHRPPEPPREAMWAAIQAQRRWYRRAWAAPAPPAPLGGRGGGGAGPRRRHRPAVRVRRRRRRAAGRGSPAA